MQWKQDELAKGQATAFALPDNATPCLPDSSQEIPPAPTASPLREDTEFSAIVMLAHSWLSDVHLYHSAEEINASASAGVLNNHLRDTGSYI